MADLRSFWFVRHLRGEASSHVALSRGGSVVKSGRGLSFWFLPLSASIWEIPVDDQELQVLFHGRSLDFQDVTTQGVISWRVTNPELLADRIDFTVDLETGAWVKEPLQQVSQILTELAQQAAWAYLAHHRIDEALGEGVEQLRDRIGDALSRDESVRAMGIEVVSVRVRSVRPTSEVEKALQMPTRERIQQEADRATFERRALAVERERAIAENELQNKIELAKQEEELIAQRGQNERRRIEEEAEAAKLKSVASAERAGIRATSDAHALTTVEAARNQAEAAQVAIYEELPQHLVLGLAVQKLAGNLPKVDHLTLSPELIGPALSRLADRTGT